METSRFQWRWFWVGLLALAALWLFWRLSRVLLPFVLAAGIAYLLNPLIDRLEVRGLSRNRSILLLLLLFLAATALLAYLVVPLLAGEINNAIDNYDTLARKAEGLYTNALSWVEGKFPWAHVRQRLPAASSAKIAEYARTLLGRMPAVLARVLQSIVGVIFLLLLTAILTFWILKEYHPIGRRLLAFVPSQYAPTAISLSRQINHLVSAYLGGQLILAALAAVIATVVLLAFHVKYAIVIGLLSGALYLIPYFGVPLAVVIAVIVSAVTGHSWTSIAGVVGCFIGMNVLMDYVVSPRVIGTRVQLHPMTIIFAVVAAGELFGFLGVFIAVPLAAATKAVLVTFFPEFFAPARPASTESPAPAGGPSGG